ncbi:molybdopterin cofactor-binding domain-containing protein [Limibacillus sp. MBR-115]|jgi:2-furoyl-CoA dehydrogenase large subunit|uniref:xanthine dehydrogenase family protein molybdopterin-binding subunit n=1 Tax=Limibacillus sp. MBR-115 TaxID=3156465 RepID=UPI00339553B9
MHKAAATDSETYVGQRILRYEDETLLRGRGKFVDDLPVAKGTLHAAFLRSPHAHARIRSIDVSEALKQKGVKAVVTGADIRPYTKPLIVGFKNPMDYRGIAYDKVRYVGEPIAVVCATDRYRAEDALKHIKVEYEPLPAIVDPVKACDEGAPVLHDEAGSNRVSRRVFTHGEPDHAFEKAANREEITIRYPRNSITPMETYGIVAEYQPDTGGYDVLSNFQGPFSVHAVMAIALKVPGSKLRHRSPPNSGGSFGSKLTIFPYIVVLAVCSRIAGRPVKWIEDRLEHLSAASVAPNRVTRIEAAYDDDGTVQAFRMEHWDDHGAYLRAPMPAPIYRMHGLSTNCYRIPNVRVINNIVMTNKCPTGAVRGFGGPQLYFAIERLMAKIARKLDRDPLDLMCHNLIRADQFPYKAPAGAHIDSGDYQKVVADSIAQGGLEELRKRRDAARAQGRLYGIGFAAAVEPSQSNMGYISTLKTAEEREKAGPKDGAVASCTVSVDPLGSVSVVGDSTPQGQGHQTTLAQIVADELGIDIGQITVNLETDTQKDNWSIAAGNYSCRFAPASTSAAKTAAERVKAKMAAIASTYMNVPAEELLFKDGYIQTRANPENRMEFRRVGGLAHWSPSSLPDNMDPGIREVAYWNAPELTPTSAQDEINTSLAYGFAFDFCGVEVDRDTGTVKIDHYVTAHDCGTILNPGLAEGQIRGSFASAVGASLYEEFVYKEDGTFLSGTFADYLIATAPEAVDPVLVETVETPSPFTRLGAKGIGEGNQYTTPVCLANAVADAIGYEDITMPLSPSKVFEWVNGDEPLPPTDTESEGAEGVDRVDYSGDALKGSGETVVPASAESVWNTLLDPDEMAAIIPGCKSLERVSDTHFKGVVSMGVGPVRGTFDAVIRLNNLKLHESAEISGTLEGSLGSSSGTGFLELVPSGDGEVCVRYRYAIHLSGTVASVGGRLLSGAARALVNQFFRALIKRAAPNAPDSGGGWMRKLRTKIGGKS